MPDPDIPEEAVADAVELDTVTTRQALLRFGSGRYRAFIESILQAAAPALRKQGAEEAEKERDEERTSVLYLEDRAEKAEAERDQALAKGAEEERERQGAKWEQAIDFLLGSMGEYGESREGKAYKNALTFIRRLAALDIPKEDNDA
jgi:hypothetical protein